VIASALTKTVARLIFAPTLVIAVAILVKGYADTGDGFAAGVVAALAVLLQYVAFGHEEIERVLPVRRAPLLGVAGLGLALAVAFVPVALGKPPMTHWPAPGASVIHVGTLEILTAVVFDIGVFLLVFGSVVGAIRFLSVMGRSAP